jgi:hypothetical protein
VTATFSVPRLLDLSDDENALIAKLAKRLESYQRHNHLVGSYYDDKARVRDFGIAIPPELRYLVESVVGWPSTAVDVLEERLEHDGWTVPGSNDDRGVSELVELSHASEEFSKGHLDALIYGVAFGVVGRGDTGVGEPEVILTVESPTRMTGIWNRRKRALESALCISYDDDDELSGAALYVPGQTIDLVRNDGKWTIDGRYPHRMPGIPVEPIVNRPRAGDMSGRSEITRAIRYYTDAGVRTLLGMEVAREFFSAPQRYALGVKQSDFEDEEGNKLTPWQSYLGKIWALPGSEDGPAPQVGQFAASSPQPFVDILRQLASLVAAEAGMSVTYLGIVHDNPASADAIRAADARLEKRAERRQHQFGAAEARLMHKALWVRDGKDPGVIPRPIWRDPGTPTRSAQAQDAVALVTAGILPADSDLTYERIGLSEIDRGRVRADVRRARARQMVLGLTGAAEAARGEVEAAGVTVGEVETEGAE